MVKVKFERLNSIEGKDRYKAVFEGDKLVDYVVLEVKNGKISYYMNIEYLSGKCRYMLGYDIQRSVKWYGIYADLKRQLNKFIEEEAVKAEAEKEIEKAEDAGQDNKESELVDMLNVKKQTLTLLMNDSMYCKLHQNDIQLLKESIADIESELESIRSAKDDAKYPSEFIPNKIYLIYTTYKLYRAFGRNISMQGDKIHISKGAWDYRWQVRECFNDYEFTQPHYISGEGRNISISKINELVMLK